MRTATEMKLMALRQKYRDYLVLLRSLPVVPLSEYRWAFIKFQTCDLALSEYRINHKRQDIA